MFCMSVTKVMWIKFASSYNTEIAGLNILICNVNYAYLIKLFINEMVHPLKYFRNISFY